MIDMTQYAKAKSDQMNAIDLVNTRQVFRIIGVQETGSHEQPIALHYEGGEGRPYKPCKSMIRVLIFVWGENGQEYVGRSFELYNDPNVTWGGEKVGGIRISRMSHMNGPVDVPLKGGGNKRFLHHVDPLPADRPRKSLAEHVDGYVAAIEAAESLETLSAVQQSEGAQKVRTAASKPGNEAQLARMNEAGSKRYAELSPAAEETGSGIDDGPEVDEDDPDGLGMFGDQSGEDGFGED